MGYSEHTVMTYCRELLNSSAVKVEAAMRSGAGQGNGLDSSAFPRGVFQATARMVALHEDRSVEEVTTEARARAMRIFQRGEDWRRELKLYETLISATFAPTGEGQHAP